MRSMIVVSLFVALGAWALTGGKTESNAAPRVPEGAPAAAPEKAAVGHPEIDEEFEFTSCATCHRLTTAEIYKDWNASTHGVANVKCYQCHGPLDQVRKVPEVSTCAICHGAKAKSMPAGRTCWNCHLTHRFKGHRSEETDR